MNIIIMIININIITDGGLSPISDRIWLPSGVGPPSAAANFPHLIHSCPCLFFYGNRDDEIGRIN